MTYAWFDVTRNAGIARIMHMSYRSKTYTWNDVILVKRIMIRVFFSAHFVIPNCSVGFIQFFFGFPLLICFFGLFDIGEFDIQRTVHGDVL